MTDLALVRLSYTDGTDLNVAVDLSQSNRLGLARLVREGVKNVVDETAGRKASNAERVSLFLEGLLHSPAAVVGISPEAPKGTKHTVFEVDVYNDTVRLRDEKTDKVKVEFAFPKFVTHYRPR